MKAGGNLGAGAIGPAAQLGRIAALAVVYVVAANLALLLAIPPGYATAIWPPSGIALAALLLYGPRMWPGVLLGAMVTNLMIQGSVLLAMLIGIGNTLEALLAAGLVRRFLGARGEFENGESVVAFVVLVTISACTAAVIGSASLTLTGAIDQQEFAPNLFVWLQGDASGMILVTPLILAWSLRPRPSLSAAKWLEAIALGACVLLITAGVFSHAGVNGALHRLTFITFSLVLWAAMRFEQRAVITVTAAISGLAAYFTLPGNGGLELGSAPEISFYMVVYTGTLAMTGLVLSAMMGLRRRAEAAIQARVHGLLDGERRVNEFLAMLSHELRNPLAAIVNAAAVMRRGQAGDPRTLGIVERQAAHLVRLVDDLLDVSRVTWGKIELKKAPADLKALVLRTLESAQPPLESGRHVVDLDLGADGATVVEVDATRLSQAILNLVTNAAKYTPNGGRIAISLAREGTNVVLKVRDNGVGIAPELMPGIFELFTQGEQSLARSDGGLGIGLTIARRIVEMHGGTLTAFSDGPGRGSLFEIRLPEKAAGADR